MRSLSPASSPFAFQTDDDLGPGFVHVLEQMAIEAGRILDSPRGTLSESVHEIRVLVKHLRALLWFASPVFSSSEMELSKSRLRKASRLLAAQRDFAVMQSILVQLSRKTSNSTFRKTIVRMAQAKDSQQSAVGKPDGSLRKAVAILLATIKDLKRYAKIKTIWPSCADRLTQAFVSAKKSRKRALHGEKAAQFHDWRKKTQRLLYQLQLTQRAPGKRMTHTILQVDKLQEELGEYHDSVVAQDRLQQNAPDKTPARLLRHCAHLLEKRKHRLRKKVRKIAGQLKMI
jgi:CHAD domain-containing protein